MARIPAGWFEMGDPGGQADEKPNRRIWLDEYFIDSTEVSNRQFAEFMNQAGYAPGDRRLPWPGFGIEYRDCRFQAKPGMENLPVVDVSWKEAQKYCAWRNKRLPTEAQWEKAARGGLAGKRFPLGDDISDKDANLHRWWDPRPLDVGSYPPNGYGLYDMAGNVAEFCRDLYDRDYYQRAPERNPFNLQPNSAMRRVVRGGSFSQPCRHGRVSRRYFASERGQEANGFTGFRCACESVRQKPDQRAGSQ